jgi:hypothetical protein
MLRNETLESDQSLVVPSTGSQQAVEVVGALPVCLQTYDLARHVAVAPNDKKYVVATFDDTRLGRGYVTAIYPQQNGYLTLLRLVLCELRSETREEAVHRHTFCIQVVQQGKLSRFVRSLQA